MAFTGQENHQISLDDAAQLTARFRESIQPGAKTGGYFSEDALRGILDQEGCVGIRYYYGLNEGGDPVLVLTGVTSDGNDLYEGELAELSIPCPNFCADSNPLNSNSTE